MRLALRATMALAALALALAAPAARRHELRAAPPAARRLEVDYEGYKKLAMEGNAEALRRRPGRGGQGVCAAARHGRCAPPGTRLPCARP